METMLHKSEDDTKSDASTELHEGEPLTVPPPTEQPMNVPGPSIPTASLLLYLDSVGVPPVPGLQTMDAVSMVWYRLGYLQLALGRGSVESPSADANEGALYDEHALGSIADALEDTLGIPATEGDNAWGRIAAAIAFMQQAEYDQVTAPVDGSQTLSEALQGDAWAGRQGETEPTRWHPVSERPAEGAEVEAEVGNAAGGPSQGTRIGIVQTQAVGGQSRFVLQVHGGQVIAWHPSNVRRWRFAHAAT